MLTPPHPTAHVHLPCVSPHGHHTLQTAQRTAHESAPTPAHLLRTVMAQQGPSVPKFHCSGCKQWLESSDPTKKRKKAVVLLVEFNLKKNNKSPVRPHTGWRFDLFWGGGQLSVENSTFLIAAAASVQLLTKGSAASLDPMSVFHLTSTLIFFQVPLS